MYNITERTGNQNNYQLKYYRNGNALKMIEINVYQLEL